jgi:hypothetical protein
MNDVQVSFFENNRFTNYNLKSILVENEDIENASHIVGKIQLKIQEKSLLTSS